MTEHQTELSKREKNWILERRFTRLTDNKEVQIYPMGAERFLSSALSGANKTQYDIKTDILGKNVLVIPGHGNSCFIFAESGAKSVTVYDKDPVTIAWVKAFKKYYHFRQHDNTPSIGELLSALTKWYPPLLSLPSGVIKNTLFWLVQPNLLRRVYIHYMVNLASQAVESKIKNDFELDKNITFYEGTSTSALASKEDRHYDTLFVPYLLGVRNGIEKEKDVIQFINQIVEHYPNIRVLITPASNKREFYITGARYFETTQHESIQSIPSLQSYTQDEDKDWFRMQGLVVLSKKQRCERI